MASRRLLIGSIIVLGLVCTAGFSAMLVAKAGASETQLRTVREAAPATGTAESKRFKVDPVHSSAVFRIKHMGVAPFYGRFNDISGEMTWNRDNPENSSLNVTIKAESIDTNNQNRDAHLRSPDFFTAREHPEITFKSTAFELKSQETYTVKGDLTLHGVTKPITIELNRTGAGEHPRSGKDLVGLETTFRIKRSDFNMNWGIEEGVLGDEVRLHVAIEGIAE